MRGVSLDDTNACHGYQVMVDCGLKAARCIISRARAPAQREYQQRQVIEAPSPISKKPTEQINRHSASSMVRPWASSV